MAKNQFDSNEAEAILMEAARRQAQNAGSGSDISRDRLHDMAAELDISPDMLEQVLADRETAAQDAELREAFIRERRATIQPKFVKALTTSLMMFALWFVIMKGHGHPWFIYPIIGVAISLIRHVSAVFPTAGSAFDVEFEQYKKQRVQKERERERRAARRDAKNATKRAEELAKQELDADPGDIITTRSYNTKTDSDDEVLRVGQR